MDAYQQRRPWADDEPDGMLESDRDYVVNNLDLAVELLDKLHADQTALADEIIDEILEEERSWIPVATALPDVDEDMGSYSSRNLLVYTAAGDTQHAYLVSYPVEDDGDDWGGPRWILVGRDAYQLDGVTHWRSLPATPRT
jgi:hypothetical protein